MKRSKPTISSSAPDLPDEQLQRIKAAICKSRDVLQEEVNTGGRDATMELALDADRPMFLGGLSREDWRAFNALPMQMQDDIAWSALFPKAPPLKWFR